MFKFFARVGRPISVNIRKDNEGKSRDAVVEFATYSQMLDAEKLDKQYISKFLLHFLMTLY